MKHSLDGWRSAKPVDEDIFGENGMTQTENILQYLKEHGSIDPMEALYEFGCFRLAARIHDLEQRGHVIPRETITQTSRRTGRKVRFTRYGRPV